MEQIEHGSGYYFNWLGHVHMLGVVVADNGTVHNELVMVAVKLNMIKHEGARFFGTV